jgi:hypothetical protein
MAIEKLKRYKSEGTDQIPPSFLGSTAQLRPWPPPQNPAEFLGGFSTFFLLQGRVVSPTPKPHHGGARLCIIYIPQWQGGYTFPVELF